MIISMIAKETPPITEKTRIEIIGLNIKSNVIRNINKKDSLRILRNEVINETVCVTSEVRFLFNSDRFFCT